MDRIVKSISLTIDEMVYHGTLKVVAEKWCYINETSHYFKVFYTRQIGKISIIGDRIHEIPLSKIIELLRQHIEGRA